MKKLLNTLYAMSEGMYLHHEGEALVAEREHHVVTRLPIHTLEGVVAVAGNVTISPNLMNLCCERGVAISYLDRNGKFLARVQGPVSGNVKLRLEQMSAYTDGERKGRLARSFVIGKVMNARNVLLRRLRDHGEDAAVADAAEKLRNSLLALRDAPPETATIRGIEGEAAAVYFGVFDRLRTAGGEAFRFAERSRRPPRDPMNALLSFVYVLLAHDCRGAVEAVGLDPQLGFLHEVRPGRASLALDLMEEFRSVLADRLVLSLVNLKQVSERDFKVTESGAVTMSDGARKTVLVAWQKKKQEEVMHPFLNEKMPAGLLPHYQALLLARYLRGDLDAYPPYLLQK